MNVLSISDQPEREGRDRAAIGVSKGIEALILATGSIVSKHFYGREIPVITLDGETFQLLRTGQHALLNGTGER